MTQKKNSDSPKANTTTVQDNEKKITEEEEAINDNGDNKTETGNKSNTKPKKKKKKKAKTTKVEELELNNSSNKLNKDDLDEIVDYILSDKPPPSSQICAMLKCKQSLKIVSHNCQYCNMKFCTSHRHPEAHSQKCVEKARDTAHNLYKQDSIRLITEERKNPGIINKKNYNAEKNKDELKKRYKEKLNKKRQEERGSSVI
ncbi:15125_t:CDS:2 [Entrophospora sp. SA101]|nr:4309_t:CDS:2 [Entrophospora sp. SA101]CAJ0650886.1 11492_t:CDS:2 [Entrophospora sp. SA101]CAJ0769015.1 15125_t:CDS:2 [Entrophospora sp. SA101]CAJ0844472.1 10763_t:CDS:2 [Entrophospora sp. SA101]CAJ0845542.1 21178_t:CDS:2 [Entrophospora sp. SA101]